TERGILITCTGSMLNEIDQSQVVLVDKGGPGPLDQVASCETPAHRAIYQTTGARAIIHTHSPYAVAVSLLEKDLIEAEDSEGREMLGAMPVVEGRFGSAELAEALAPAMVGRRACVARGHGVFAAGQTLQEAYTVACMAEHSSQVLYLVRQARGDWTARQAENRG
ncbi:MAG: fuculose phosphate aldolase, partial [Methanosarcinales archaeon]|nr:fuculose phosphate aldolase [Methanosarcinales archaeon]